MALNINGTRSVFQNELDKLMVEQLTSGFMEENAGNIIYNGGREVKIPTIIMDGLKDYSRTDGYPVGAVNLSYQTVTMTMDRGEGFTLDAMDVEETNFVASASNVLGEFQRTQVVPEVDAYRYSKIHGIVKDKAASNIRAESTALTEKNIYKSITSDIDAIKDEVGESVELVVVINGKARGLLNQNETFTKNLTQVDFKKGEITTKVRSIDECPIIQVPSALLFTEYDFFKGNESSGQKAGFKKKSTAKQINYIIMPKKAAIAVCKQDAPKIITPELNQKADAWFIGYRKYHDLWLKDSSIKGIRISTEAWYMLEQIKTLLGITDTESDALLGIMIDDARSAIISYLNRKDFPEGLNFAIREMVVKAYKESVLDGVTSIERGDTSISYTAIDSSYFDEKLLRAFSKYKKIRMD